GLFFVLLFLSASTSFADQILMTLSLENRNVQVEEEFILKLEIYGAPPQMAPEVQIDGLDDFSVKSIGKNLLQVPNGKTVKWILSYTISPEAPGKFWIGPATTGSGGRIFSSNRVFISVEGTPKPKPAPPPPPPPKPVVMSAAQIGEKV